MMLLQLKVVLEGSFDKSEVGQRDEGYLSSNTLFQDRLDGTPWSGKMQHQAELERGVVTTRLFWYGDWRSGAL